MGGEFFARLVSPEESFPPRAYMPTLPQARHAAPRVIAPSSAREGKVPVLPDRGLSSPPSLPASPGQEIKGRSETKGTIPKYEVPVTPLKEKLFDKGIIGDLAKKETEKGEKGEKEQIFTFETKELRYLSYLRRLKERIESIWVYPPDAIAQGIYGDLIIKFTIKKSGRLGAVELVRTSGYKNLDSAALKALRNAEPFWPLPAEWGIDAYTIEGHFIYTIYGYYIR